MAALTKDYIRSNLLLSGPVEEDTALGALWNSFVHARQRWEEAMDLRSPIEGACIDAEKEGMPEPQFAELNAQLKEAEALQNKWGVATNALSKSILSLEPSSLSDAMIIASTVVADEWMGEDEGGEALLRVAAFFIRQASEPGDVLKAA